MNRLVGDGTRESDGVVAGSAGHRMQAQLGRLVRICFQSGISFSGLCLADEICCSVEFVFLGDEKEELPFAAVPWCELLITVVT